MVWKSWADFSGPRAFFYIWQESGVDLVFGGRTWLTRGEEKLSSFHAEYMHTDDEHQGSGEGNYDVLSYESEVLSVPAGLGDILLCWAAVCWADCWWTVHWRWDQQQALCVQLKETTHHAVTCSFCPSTPPSRGNRWSLHTSYPSLSVLEMGLQNDFKILLLVFKALHSQAPAHTRELLTQPLICCNLYHVLI